MLLTVACHLTIVAKLFWSGRRSTEYAVPVFCFFLTLMPLESRLVIPGLFDVTIMRLSLLTLLVLYLVKRKPPAYGSILFRNLMLLHVAWALCSTVYSISFATSAKQLIAQVLEYYLLYFLIVRSITREKTVYRMLYGMVMAMSLCCVFSILEVGASYSILRLFPSNLWITYNGGL